MSECFPGKLPWDKPHILLWVILAMCALNVIFLGGKRRAFGVFVAEFHVDYPNITLAELDWIGDSYSAFGYLTTSVSSALIIQCKRRYALFQLIGSVFILVSCISSSFVPNPHWLFLTHTLLHGIGSSFVLSCTGLVVNEYFGKSHPYHVLATTLVSGGSVASILFVTFFAFLIKATGWRTTLLILGGIYFFVCGSASIFIRKKKDIPDVERKDCCKCDMKGMITKTQIPLLILWTFDRMLTSIVTYGLLMNLTDYQRRLDHSIIDSTTLTTLFAAGEASTYLIGAIIGAVTKDILYDRLRYILCVFTFCMATCLVGWEFAVQIPALSEILSFFSGFFLGPSITFLFPAGEEITRLPGYIAYPFSLAGMGVGMFISPLLSAVIAQAFKYKYFFVVQGGLMYVKFLLLLTAILILHFCHDKMLKRDDYETLIDKEEDSVDDKKDNGSAIELLSDEEGNREKEHILASR